MLMPVAVIRNKPLLSPWLSKRPKLRLGFAPTIDCAPVIAAAELGLFQRYEVPVTLSRETGWATIREKLVHREMEMATAPASMAFAITCGIGVVARPCLTGLVLNLNGSAITLSNDLRQMGIRDAASLRQMIMQEKGRRQIVIASVHELGSQNYILRDWLRAAGIDPDHDVRLPVVPSQFVHENLRAGYLDGYCVAEPWNSLLTMQGEAWTVAATSELAPAHPEKAVLVLQDFHQNFRELHLATLAAILEGCAYCGEPANRPELIRMLAQPQYLNVPEAVLECSLLRPFQAGSEGRPVPDFITYHGGSANAPDRPKARWIYRQIERHGLAQSSPSFQPEVMRRVFREDIYREAAQLAFPPQSKAPDFSPTAARAPLEGRFGGYSSLSRLSAAISDQLTRFGAESRAF